MLLNNASRSLLHPTWNMGSGIEPFFRAWDPPNASLAPVAAGQQSVADVIAGTPCTSVGLANWVMYEYPVWIALQNAGWHGRIDNVDVQDASKVLADPTVHPCALIRQVAPSYVTADPDMVSFRFGPMALSLPSSIVGENIPDQAGFHSDVTGVRVRPGTGWVLGGETPAVNGSARIYLISDKARTVRLRITGATGDIAGWQRTAGELTMTMTLTSGITTLDLPMTPGKASPIGTVSMVLPN
jgi:hypothetical protein